MGRTLGTVGFALGPETFTLMYRFSVSKRPRFPQPGMQGGAGAYRTRLRFPGERIRRSGLGEMILFRYNSETQFCHDAPVAQLDRVLGYEPRGWEFDSLRAHQSSHRTGFRSVR